jgi:SAM-dependent methyltransferase
MVLHALTIFVSAFLLFLVQPVIAKQILPWFGGSAAVWTTCLVFFQCALLAGYFYSDWTTRKLDTKRQALLHVGLIVIAMLLLPIVPDAAWKPKGDEDPGLRILLLLTVTIGLPYFLLSTTSPLIQAWFARENPGASPYRLFALSNLASMLALLGYPFLIEPHVGTRQQAVVWSIGFSLFAMLIGLAAWRSVRATPASAWSLPSVESAAPSTPPTRQTQMVWAMYAALGSMLLLAVSNHLTHNISSIPLFWVVPLALYLLTFILCFEAKEGRAPWYQRTLFLPMLGVFLVSMAWLIADKSLHFELYWQMGVFSAGLFVACMFCHGELAGRKPAPAHLTRFYLMVSVGGAFGSLLVGVAAPMLLPAYFELEISLVLLAILGTWVTYRRFHWMAGGIAAMLAAFVIGATGFAIHQLREDVVIMQRNFYGSLRVKEYVPPAVQYRRRSLVHGAILHGDQYLDPPYNKSATTYYKAKSGVGRMLLLKERLQPNLPRKVGVIGLGAGTLATYGNKGDVFRFYDINPDVVSIANRDFTYLKQSDAKIETPLGDARLNLEREDKQNFDVLAVDAFSSDSIPVHLITLEALQAYERHMKPDGVIAFHVSNRFLDLKPVVQKLADHVGLHTAWIRETHDDGSTSSDWVLLSRDKTLLLKQEIVDASYIIPPQPGWRLWTDDFNNLLQVMK